MRVPRSLPGLPVPAFIFTMVTGSQGNQRLLAELSHYAEQGAVTIATVANYVKCSGGLLLPLVKTKSRGGQRDCSALMVINVRGQS